nr:MAG TPA: Thioredoxin [Caudoviricetes sp.]
MGTGSNFTVFFLRTYCPFCPRAEYTYCVYV